MDDGDRCTAQSKQGRRCRRMAIPGGTVCRYHGGNAPQVRRAARRRVQEEQLRRKLVDLLDELDIDPGDRDPGEVLASAMGRAASMAEALEAVVGQLRVWHGLAPADPDAADNGANSGGAGSLPPEKASVVAAWFGPDHLGDGAPHVATEMMHRWNAQAAKLAKLALDAGVEERRVRLAEDQGEVLAEVIRASMASMAALVVSSLPADWRPVVASAWEQLVGGVVRHHLSALSADGETAPSPLPAAPVLELAPVPVPVASSVVSPVPPVPAPAPPRRGDAPPNVVFDRSDGGGVVERPGAVFESNLSRELVDPETGWRPGPSGRGGRRPGGRR